MKEASNINYHGHHGKLSLWRDKLWLLPYGKGETNLSELGKDLVPSQMPTRNRGNA